MKRVLIIALVIGLAAAACGRKNFPEPPSGYQTPGNQTDEAAAEEIS